MKAEARPFRTRDGRDLLLRSPRPNEAGAVLDHAWEVHSTDAALQVGDPDEFTMTAEHLAGVLRASERSGNSCFLAAFSGAEVVGTLWMEGARPRKLRHTAELGVGVRRAWRRQGVARALLLHAAEVAAASGVLRRLTLSVFSSNSAAIALYESLGFLLEGRRLGQVLGASGEEDELLMALRVG